MGDVIGSPGRSELWKSPAARYHGLTLYWRNAPADPPGTRALLLLFVQVQLNVLRWYINAMHFNVLLF